MESLPTTIGKRHKLHKITQHILLTYKTNNDMWHFITDMPAKKKEFWRQF